MNCLKEEIRKILYNKTMIVFMVICIIFNIGLIIATSSKSGEWKKMSENYEYQSGQKIWLFIRMCGIDNRPKAA